MNFSTKIEKQDITEIINSKYINWNNFKNSSILVTGATGLIGSSIVKSLLYANEILNSNIKIYALVRDKKKAFTKFGKAVNYVVQNITNPLKINKKIDFIIHTANSTSSKSFVEEPVETIDSIVQGTKNILNFAKEKKVKSVVYLSSMEVFGKTDFDRKEPLSEKDYGYIDISELRSSYPESKRLAENMCVAYAKEYDVPVKVARLVQTIGAGVDYYDNRVFAQFARNIVERKDIVLHTTGESIRSYCYITDAISAIFVLLERGKKAEFYNVSNEQTTCSIKQMAEMLCKKYTSSKLIIDLNAKYYPADSKLYITSNKITNLEWFAKVSLEEMFNKLIQDFYLREKPIVSRVSDRKPLLKKILHFFFNSTKNTTSKKITILGFSLEKKIKQEYYEICKNTDVVQNKIALIDNHNEGYSGHLKYIADELIKQNINCEIVWLDKFSNNIDDTFPKQIKKVQTETEEAAKELASAKIWLATQRNNNMLRKGLFKKENQVYIQLWHGSLGIKKVGFDIHPTKEEDWMELAKKDSLMLDYAISNSDFETNVYRGIFWGQGKSLLMGHPRNDIFFKDNSPLKEFVFNKLGIDLNKKVILYAPTYRDDNDLTCYNMDYEKVIQTFEERFNSECVLILRFHPWALNRCQHLFGNNPKIINGNKYSDIQELMAVSDFMITDYSSCIFDFLFTGKPGFIYASDIEKYNNDRGFYYPIERTPFSIATNNQEFFDNIQNFNNNEYNKKIKEFLNYTGCIEDGTATKNVVFLLNKIMGK